MSSFAPLLMSHTHAGTHEPLPRKIPNRPKSKSHPTTMAKTHNLIQLTILDSVKIPFDFSFSFQLVSIRFTRRDTTLGENINLRKIEQSRVGPLCRRSSRGEK
jgi:hypothetical protein